MMVLNIVNSGNSQVSPTCLTTYTSVLGDASQLTQWPTGKPIFFGKIYHNNNYQSYGIWLLHMCHKPDGSACDLPPVTGKGMCQN